MVTPDKRNLPAAIEQRVFRHGPWAESTGRAEPLGLQVSSHPNGHDHEWHALTEKLPLQCEHREVMEQSCEARFLRKHELAAEENRVRETLHDFRSDLVRGLDDVVAHFRHRLSMEILCAHVVRVARHVSADVAAKVFQFACTFEVPCIHEADLDKNEIPEHAGEHVRDVQDGVNTETIETIHEEYGGASGGIARGGSAVG